MRVVAESVEFKFGISSAAAEKQRGEKAKRRKYL
jgi:hypothetical protein